MVDTLDSKSGVRIGRAGSNPARGTKCKINKKLWFNPEFSFFEATSYFAKVANHEPVEWLRRIKSFDFKSDHYN